MANADDELNIQRLIDAQTMKLKVSCEQFFTTSHHALTGWEELVELPGYILACLLGVSSLSEHVDFVLTFKLSFSGVRSLVLGADLILTRGTATISVCFLSHQTHVEDLQARLSRLTSQAEKQSKLELTWKERVAELQEVILSEAF